MVPDKLEYAGKKYYLMTKPYFIAKINIGHLKYYCNNHRLNTTNKRLLFKNELCNGQIKYIRNTNKFYIIHLLNKICDGSTVFPYMILLLI